MGKIRYEDFDSDEYYGSFQKIKSKGSKKRFKGHQTRHGQSDSKMWEQMDLDSTVYEIPRLSTIQPQQKATVISSTVTTSPQKSNTSMASTIISKPTVQSAPKKEFVFGPNTHDFKGVKIDLDGVAVIEKVENVKNGQTTYGIKFTFKGPKGLSKTVWYNINMRARDAVYNIEYAFWLNLQTNNK